VRVEPFIAARRQAPGELGLDIDASDVPLHGDQERSQFHGSYDHDCSLLLSIFWGQTMRTCLLRPSRIDGARHAAAVIKLPVTRLRHGSVSSKPPLLPPVASRVRFASLPPPPIPGRSNVAS
jgi:hypothetical protein